ncbi:MAG: isoleucine--tRNA ligase [Verrucomicrobia bacterium]|nr:isoleucine--tRNA ligase [Verrucomicrobiota bacterium]
MKADLITREPARLAQWEADGLYGRIQEARKEAPLFVLHDGPPFANGDVHMGTALNKTLKDLIVKSKTMLGYRTPFIPGWDCHGLPIEFKVVKESRGLSPLEIRQKSEAYARKFIDIQRRQFRRLGVFGDWENPYLTLAPEYECEIIRAFGTFVEKGLVYQSMKPVYWSTGAQTALAEAEVEYADRTDPAIFVKFAMESGPLAGKASMVIWTTTPWTLPANVAIAVHPRHKYVCKSFKHVETGRHEVLVVAEALLTQFRETTGWEAVAGEAHAFTGEELAGTQTRHPFLDRVSPIILADFVTLETGTGGVHIAPGHGADDYMAGMKYGLPILSPVDEHGRFTEEVGIAVWTGKYVFDANADVVEHLRASGALLGEQKYTHSYPHCWRSKTPVVFRAVEQFFIRIDAIRQQALTEIDAVNWLPHWGRNRIYGTVESRPDWCISRQRSWGVPLPVFYSAAGEPILDAAVVRKVGDLVETHGTNLWFEKDDVWWAQAVGLPAGTTRRNDTLDVWIDSGVSHTAVVKKRPELRFPADVYLEATDQHRGWFQSSLMTSVAMHGQAPYRTVVTHGFVVDKDGKKISKSSSYQKPMDAEHFVGKYGADIVRLWVSSVQFTDEVPFSEEAFTRLGEAYRLFRNTLRILLANLSDFDPAQHTAPREAWTMVDRWVMSRLQGVIGTCREAYDAYEFRRVFQTLNQFCAVDLSALYVDITKDRMYCDGTDSPRRRATQTVMHAVFNALTRLLAPILVYTADEAFEFAGNPVGAVHLQTFPEADAALADAELESHFETLLALRGVIAQAVEPARKEKLIGNALEAAVTLQIADAALLATLQGREAELEEFFILSKLTLEAGAETKATLIRTPDAKCGRCWRHKPTVGADAKHPELCDRCAEVAG